MSIVRFENVTKQFSEDSYGVREITFSISPGEFIFVTGPSGSGKTTLMRLLLKEYEYTDGEIYFHDVALSDIKQRHVHLHRRKIGMVFQDYKLIPEMNIWENIALPLSVTGKPMEEIERRVTDLLNLIKLPEKALQFPSQLSGGEAQRVGIARALAVGPEVVIADEPTGNLDPETAQSIARLLKKINELGTTVIIATHDRTILSAYPETRKLILEKGALTGDEAPKKSTTHKVTVSVTEITEEPDRKPVEKKEIEKKETEEKHDAKLTKKPDDDVAKKTDKMKESKKPTEKSPETTTTTTIVTTVTTEDLDEPEEAAAPKTSWWSKVFGKKKKSDNLVEETSKKSAAEKNPTPPESKEKVVVKKETLDEPVAEEPKETEPKKKPKEVKEKVATKKSEK